MIVSRRDFLKYTAAGAGALALPQLVGSGVAEASPANAPCIWGAFPDPGVTSPTDAQVETAITDFESLIGRKLGMTRHYIRWDYPTIPSNVMVWSANGGRVPFMDWRPQKMNDDYVKWADIAAGTRDTYIASVAEAFKTRLGGKKVFLTFNHEPENDAANNGPTGTAAEELARAREYKAAYTHVKKIFVAHNVKNVKWVCTLVQGTYKGANGGADAWFPNAAAYVGADGYNRGACSGGWKSFSSLFRDAHDFARLKDKNMVVEEWGCAPPNACGGTAPQTKAQWFTDAGDQIEAWPEVKAVIYTHVNALFRGKQVDFRVNKPTTTELSAYKTVGKRAHFN
ncbi:MAG: twin-arginine translocation signal domain-containing protein [Actinomycetota bacterium]|nr:twin-arginine translocation signal domain-containing protein [Actinomycetota bacterium]